MQVRVLNWLSYRMLVRCGEPNQGWQMMIVTINYICNVKRAYQSKSNVAIKILKSSAALKWSKSLISMYSLFPRPFITSKHGLVGNHSCTKVALTSCHKCSTAKSVQMLGVENAALISGFRVLYTAWLWDSFWTWGASQMFQVLWVGSCSSSLCRSVMPPDVYLTSFYSYTRYYTVLAVLESLGTRLSMLI